MVMILCGRHPERSRSSGGAKDLAWNALVMRARSLAPLVKARRFGMTPLKRSGLSKNSQILRGKEHRSG